MGRFKFKYLCILKIEIQDLIKDIRLLISVHEKKYKDQDMTQYLCLENVAVLKNISSQTAIPLI